MKVLILTFATMGFALAQFGGVYRGGFPRYTTPRPQYSPQPPQYQQQYRPSGPPIAIRSQTSDISPDGSYAFTYETENGISAAESGVPKSAPDGQAEVVQGRYSYTAPDGTPITVEYYADETGFHATGAHIPTPPPIPAEIQRAIASLPPSNEGQYNYQDDEGQYNPRPAYNRNLGTNYRNY